MAHDKPEDLPLFLKNGTELRVEREVPAKEEGPIRSEGILVKTFDLMQILGQHSPDGSVRAMANRSPKPRTAKNLRNPNRSYIGIAFLSPLRRILSAP
jgi:hypothetical protein